MMMGGSFAQTQSPLPPDDACHFFDKMFLDTAATTECNAG
jgi:hypothetical protein